MKKSRAINILEKLRLFSEQEEKEPGKPEKPDDDHSQEELNQNYHALAGHVHAMSKSPGDTSTYKPDTTKNYSMSDIHNVTRDMDTLSKFKPVVL